MDQEIMKQVMADIPPWMYALFVGGGATLLAGWSRIKGMVMVAITKLGTSVELDGDLAAVLFGQLAADYPASRFSQKGYIVLNEQLVTGARKWLLARWISKSKSETFWVPHAWIKKKFLISVSVPLNINRGSDGSIMTINYIRGTLDIENVLREIVAKANAQEAGDRYKVVEVTGGGGVGMVGVAEQDRQTPSRAENYSSPVFTRQPTTAYYLDVKPEMIGSPKKIGTAESLWWSPTASVVLRTAEKWFEAREWYDKCGKSWKHGFLLVGRPGTGKTSMVRAIAMKLDLPIFSFNMSSLTSQELQSAWTAMLGEAPCVALFEDFDAVYHEREAVNPNPQRGTPPSFSTVLECLDGVNSNNGVLTFITSNKMEHIDAALGGQGKPRPGRVDRVVQTDDTVSLEGKKFIAAQLFGDKYDADVVHHLVEDTGACTPAVFSAACVDVLRGYL